jgi:hypothetical protein
MTTFPSRCVVSIGSLVLFSHTVSAQWVQIGNNQLRAFSPMRLAVNGGNLFAATAGGGVFRCPENDTAFVRAGTPAAMLWF